MKEIVSFSPTLSCWSLLFSFLDLYEQFCFPFKCFVNMQS